MRNLTSIKSIFILILLFLCSCHKEQTTQVTIDVQLNIEDDLTSPVYVSFDNKTKNAGNYQWTFEGGEPATSSLKNPGTVKFTTPGEHLITLEARNEGHNARQTYSIRVDSIMQCSFNVEHIVNNYAPAEFIIRNTSGGASNYKWVFYGGFPELHEGKTPPNVLYKNPGEYKITLTTSNGSNTLFYETVITVLDSLYADFSIVPSLEDMDDMEAPLRATFSVNMRGVKELYWECGGAEITNHTSTDANIFFPTAGIYTVHLNISNNKNSKKISKTITVKDNCNLREHKDIKLGITTAQNTVGSFYSTKLRQVVLSNQLNNKNLAKNIDIAFLGFNNKFTYNSFISPDSVDSTPLEYIANAQKTKFINRTESGNISISVAQFESMSTDALLDVLDIKSASYGSETFDSNNLPRVVLFETEDGRKGAILVKEMIENGHDSYINVDIKVQKND